MGSVRDPATLEPSSCELGWGDVPLRHPASPQGLSAGSSEIPVHPRPRGCCGRSPHGAVPASLSADTSSTQEPLPAFRSCLPSDYAPD